MAKEKDYSVFLVGAKPEENKGKRILNFLLGSQRKVHYYDARHRENGVRLMWMESMRWNEMRCYPCVLEKEDETIVFQSGNLKDCRDNNLRLVREWESVVDKDRLEREYEVEALTAKDFDEIFRKYRKEDLERAIAQAERENGIVKDELPPAEDEGESKE